MAIQAISKAQNSSGTQESCGAPLTPNSTESKVDLMRQKIVTLNNKIETNEKTIEDLKTQLKEAGIRPNGAIPIHDGIVISNKEGELGELETKSFSLEKKISYQEYFISSMKRQLANAK